MQLRSTSMSSYPAVAVGRCAGECLNSTLADLLLLAPIRWRFPNSTLLDWTISGLVVAMFGGDQVGKTPDAGKLAGANNHALSFPSTQSSLFELACCWNSADVVSL